MFSNFTKMTLEKLLYERLVFVYRAILLLSLAVFVCLAVPAAYAGCTEYDWDVVTYYVDVPSNNFLTGSHPVYSNPGCQDPPDHYGGFGPGTAFANNGPSAMSICEANMDQTVTSVRKPFQELRTFYCEVGNQLGSTSPVRHKEHLYIIPNQPDAQSALDFCRRTRPFANHIEPHAEFANYWHCYYTWTSGSGRAGGSGGSAGGGGRSRPDLPLTGLRVHAFDGAGSGIQFKRLDNYGIGDQSVIDMGFLDAVDVFFNIGSGYDVCFPQTGRIVFLDAATSPRTVAFPENRHEDGWTCASMARAGTMVLVNAPEGTVAQTSTATTTTATTSPRRPGSDDDISTAIDLQHCLALPRVDLRLREAPWGQILDVVPRGIEVRATSRTRSWFRTSYDGSAGWIAAWLTTADSDCDWETEQSDISTRRYQLHRN